MATRPSPATSLLVALLACGGAAPAEPLSPEQVVGQMLYMDANRSLERNPSSNSCHAILPATRAGDSGPFPAPGFIDPLNVRDGSAVSAARGALNAPSAGYAE